MIADEEKERAEKRMWANLAANPPIRKVVVSKVFVLCSCAPLGRVSDGRFQADDAEVVGVFEDKQMVSQFASAFQWVRDGRLYYIVEHELMAGRVSVGDAL